METCTRMTLFDARDHEVRYESGRLIYTEALIEGRWAGRWWNPHGHVEFPGIGSPEPAFGLEAGGQPLRDGWSFLAANEAAGDDGGVRHVVVELLHERASVAVRVHTLLDGTPVLCRFLEIENRSDRPLPLTAVNPWCGELWRPDGFLGMQEFTLGYFTQADWACEGWFEWLRLPAPQPMNDGRTRVRSDRGQGHDAPFFIVRNDTKGEYFIGHLAWSANWEMEFDRRTAPDGRSTALWFRIGPWASVARRVLAPGETVTTPAVHMGHVSGDLDDAVQAMHGHLRRSVLPVPRAERRHLVQMLVPCDQGYYMAAEFNEDAVRRSIDVAAEIGAEVFTLDAGWWDITCDWYPSKTRFPRGLEPVREYVHERGMLFGLYIESEGGRGPIERSWVGRTHPEWLGPKNIVNLSKPDAAAWVESEIRRVIEEYRPDLYRLDFNPQFTGEGMRTERKGFSEDDYLRYYAAFDGIYNRLRRDYPDLILQQCAAGGARNDLGTARHFHETYLTDGLWMPHVLRVYAGQTLALPPESLVIALGAPGWKGPLDTYLRATFSLSTPLIAFGPAPSVAEINPEARAAFARYGRICREFIRPLLPTCRMYHHAPVSAHGGVTSGGWFAVEFASPDRTRGWATVIRIGADPSDTFHLIPRGLDCSRTYRVTFDSADATATVDGLSLMRDGLRIRLESAVMSELLLFEAV